MENNNTYSEGKYRDLPFKDKAAYVTAIASFCLGWLMLFVGLLLPPTGEIAPSVITAFGTALVYTASVFGIFLYIKGSSAEMWDKMMREINSQVERRMPMNRREADICI